MTDHRTQLLTAFCVPDSRGFVQGSRYNTLCVRTEGDAKDIQFPSTAEAAQFIPALRIPNSHCPVLRRSNNSRAIWAKCGSYELFFMSNQSLLCTALSIPHPSCLVLRGSNNAHTVRAESCTHYKILVTHKPAQLGAARQIP